MLNESEEPLLSALTVIALVLVFLGYMLVMLNDPYLPFIHLNSNMRELMGALGMGCWLIAIFLPMAEITC